MSRVDINFEDKKKKEEFSMDKIYATSSIIQTDPKIMVGGSEYEMKEFQELCDNMIGKPKLNEKQKVVFNYWVKMITNPYYYFSYANRLILKWISDSMIYEEVDEDEKIVQETYKKLSLEEEYQVVKAFMEWNINYQRGKDI